MTVRVLWVIKGLGPGGSEQLLVAAAGAHDRSVVDLTCAYVLATKDHLVGPLEARGVLTICLAPSRWTPWPFHLRRLISTGGFDIIHIHSPAPGIVARVAVRTIPASRRPKIVTTEHNAERTYRLPVRWANRWTSRFDDATITVSDEALQSLRGPARRRAHSLRHGIDVASVTADAAQRDEVRDELGVGPACVVVGTVANFREQKDYPNLIAAFALLRDRGVACHLVAVGQGPLEAEMRALVAESGLADMVTLTGYRSDATRVMNAFDVFVLASSFEGLPVALMEALALGLPVVATAVGGVAEALRDGETALLVPAGDAGALASALESVVSDAALRARLAAASLALAPEFDVHRATAAIEATYATLVPDSAPASPPDHVPKVAPRRPGGSGVQLREATADDRPAMIEMMRGPLQWGDDPRNAQLFAWKHDDNAFGRSPMWIAVDDDRVVAVRTFMRWEFARGDEIVKVVRAVDTATDPAYQGRGLFRELTMMGVDELTRAGTAWVFNTPNEQSRPGYLSMGWHDVGRLACAVIPRPSGVATTVRSRVPADRWSVDITSGEPLGAWVDDGGLHRWSNRGPHAPGPRTLHTPLSEPFMRWRFGTELVPYRVLESESAATVVRVRRRGRARELVVALTFGDEAAADALVRQTLSASQCDHALRLGRSHPLHGSVPMPGAGPLLTWRSLSHHDHPPLSNWQLALGDIELF